MEPTLRDDILGWEPFVVAVPQGSGAPDVVSLDWLHAQQVLLLEHGHCLRDQTLSLCSVPTSQHSPFRATSLGTMVQMVSAGLGVSVVPAMAVPVEAGRAELEVRAFAGGGIGRTLRLVSADGHPMAGLFDEVADVLRAVMSGGSQPPDARA